MYLQGTLLFLAVIGACGKKYVKGPRSYDDKIAIVGAGVSGVHMAYLLKRKGFTNVQVLEKTSKIGGKSETIKYRGAAHDLGTCYISPDYKEVIRLVKEHAPKDEMIPFPSASIWLDTVNYPMPYARYMMGFASKILKSKNPKVIQGKVVYAIMKYVKMHKQIFGIYDGELMPRPTKVSMSKLKSTFLHFIIRNNLQLLIPIFQASTTIQGYGQLGEIAALYGLMWNTPNFMLAFIKRLKDKKGAGMYVMKNGFQTFWKNLAEKERLNIQYNVNIRSMYRSNDDSNKVQNILLYKSVGNQQPRWEHYDFLIWSPEMKTSLPLWDNVTPNERELFNKTKPTFFTSSLIDYFDAIRGLTPIDYWVDKVQKKEKNSMWAQRDTFSVVHGYVGPKYINKTFPTGNDSLRKKTVVAYQMADNKPEQLELQRGLVKQIKSIGGRQIYIKKQMTWRYFPRYSPKDIEAGVLWDIFDMQGKHAMWYIGSSVCFESVKSVVQYNLQLVKNMEPIPQKRL